MNKVSALVPTFNEEAKLKECLESVSWADEILVVDSGSTDRTLEIAQAFGARILHHEYINSARQKNWAIPQCRNEWVLQIDADERLDAQLQEEMQQLLNNPPADVDGFRSPFKHHILGQWVRTMDLYPEYHLRLFRRDQGRFQEREVDAHVIVPGRVLITSGHFLHYGVERISQRLAPLDRYTRYEADEREKQGRRFSWFNLLLRPPAAFLYYFVLKQGYKSGFRGIFIAALKADFVFWTYAKLWEKEWLSKTRQ